MALKGKQDRFNQFRLSGESQNERRRCNAFLTQISQAKGQSVKYLFALFFLWKAEDKGETALCFGLF